MRPLAMTVTLIVALISPAAAQMTHSGHDAPPDLYSEAMTTMHEEMMIPPTGDADVDFIRSMIVHHEGAVAMAQIVLDHGSDPQVRKLAQDILEAQQKEIGWMQDWLAAHP
jgi:uncharacterized protein (DUF305 family)